MPPSYPPRTPALRIRRALARDSAAIQLLVRAAYSPYVARIGRPPAPMTQDYRQVIAAGNTWVAEDAELIVGVLVPSDDHLLIENVAVTPARQGTGVGLLLLRTAEDQATQAGFGEIRLYTNEAMVDNIAYYTRQGYRQTHRVIEHRYRRVYFAKSLPLSPAPGS